MWPNSQFPADLVTSAEEICNGKLYFLCSDNGLDERFDMDMLSSFWRTTCPTWCASHTGNNSKKNNPKRTPICSSEKWVHQKSMDSCFKPRALLCKVSTLASNQLYAEHCSNVIVLLCTAKTQRMQSLMQTLFRSDLKPIIL